MMPTRFIRLLRLVRSVALSLYGIRRIALGYLCLLAVSMSVAAGVSALTNPSPMKSTAQPACSKVGHVCRAPRTS